MRTINIIKLGLATAAIDCAATAPKRVSVPVRRQNGLQRRDRNEVASTEHVVVDFTFGGQQIPVAIDTGSSFTYVASTLDANKSETDFFPTLFNPNISSTYHDENDPSDADDCSNASYGHATCVLGQDNVATAGLTAPNMTFGVASQVSPDWFESGQAATMGLGRQAGDPNSWLPRDQTFWWRAGAGLEMPYLFAIDLYQDQNGTFDFGYLDTNKYTGNITFGAMDTSLTNWNLNFTAYSIGNNSSLQTVSGFTGIVDTGGPNIGLPSSVTGPYFESFGGTSDSSGTGYNYPCSAYPPPDLILSLQGGGQLVLNGSFLVEPPSDESKRSDDDTCQGRIDDEEQTAYNLGACVFDQKFVVFDHANARIGFADKRGASDPTGVLAPSGTSYPSASTSAATATGSSEPSSSATNPGSTATPPSSTGVKRFEGWSGTGGVLGSALLVGGVYVLV